MGLVCGGRALSISTLPSNDDSTGPREALDIERTNWT